MDRVNPLSGQELHNKILAEKGVNTDPNYVHEAIKNKAQGIEATREDLIKNSRVGNAFNRK